MPLCRSILCGAAQQTLSLACEKVDVISTVAAVGISIAPPVCSDALVTNTSLSACDLSVASAMLESACVDEVRCDVDASAVIAAACTNPIAALQLYARVECKEAPDTLTILILALYTAISFGIGATLRLEVFVDIWRNKKRAFLIGWASQFGFMPLLAFAMTHIFDLDALSAIGVILCGCAPGGTTSNLLTYWVNGNAGLSIAMSVASTICSVFMIPLLFLIYVKSSYAQDLTLSPLPADAVLIPLACVIVGTSLGMLVKRFNKERQCGCSWRRCFYWQWAEKIGSLIGFLFLVAAFIFGVRDDPELLVPSDFPKLWGIASLFQPMGALFGYVMATLGRLDMADRRAVCIETGVQSYPMILVVVGLSWSGCEKIEIRAFVIIATFWYLLSTAWMIPVIQLLTVKDSCISRCIKRPPTLSVQLPKQQSTEVASAKAGEGGPRRLGASELPAHCKFGKEFDNCYSLFARAAALHPHNRCFGTRTKLPSGNHGDFTWSTYREVHERVVLLGSGAAQLGLGEKATFGMYASNSERFQIATLGMMSQGHTCVPIYDTLGEDVRVTEATPNLWRVESGEGGEGGEGGGRGGGRGEKRRGASTKLLYPPASATARSPLLRWADTAPAVSSCVSWQPRARMDHRRRSTHRAADHHSAGSLGPRPGCTCTRCRPGHVRGR